MTLDLGDRLTEVYYPAIVEADDTIEIFDSLSVFPEELQSFIPPELTGLVNTTAVRDATPAAAPTAGFPVVVYSHGFGGFRQAASAYTTHLASWGYVVLSTDHLERGIAAQATGTLGEGLENQDVLDVIASVNAAAADSTLGSVVDLDHVAVTGHSAGGWAAAQAASDDLIDGFVSIAAGLPENFTDKPALVVIGELDSVVSPSQSYELFDQLTNATLVNIKNGGHNSFTDSCRGIRDLGGLGSLEALIGADQVERANDGCVEGFVEPEAALAALNHYTVRFLRVLFGDASIAVPATDVHDRIVVDDLDAADIGNTVTVEFADFQVS